MSETRQWEVYQRRDSYRMRGSRRGEAVTIGRTGYLSFSADAFARLGSPQAVKFLVDKDERLIGFQPCKPREANAHAVGAKTHSTSARLLLEYMDVDYSEGRSYDLHVEDGVPPYIDLKTPGVPVTSNRAREQQ